MLIEFSVENYRSIKDEISFSFIASSDNSLEDNIIKLSKMINANGKPILNDKDDILKSSVIYGPNASGKSNIILSLALLRYLILYSGSFIPGQKIPYTPFKLDNTYTSKPTRFQISFIKNNIQYVYELVYNADKIIKESLVYYPNNRKALIFDIDDKYPEGYKFTIDISKQKEIYKRKLENIPYLTSSALQNYKKTREAFSWFKDNLEPVGPTERFGVGFTTQMLNESEEAKESILKALLYADFGICDIKAITENESYEKNQGTASQKQVITKTKINTFHKGYDENSREIDILFDFLDESEGTKRMYTLIGPFIDVLRKGKVLVIDELDIKLHNKLCRYLIQLFHNPIQNKYNAQLLFTSHNTNLLDLSLFRRDQIWFTKKDIKDQHTDLYSLLMFKQRSNTNVENAYNIGRYGALPRINDFAGIVDD